MSRPAEAAAQAPCQTRGPGDRGRGRGWMGDGSAERGGARASLEVPGSRHVPQAWRPRERAEGCGSMGTGQTWAEQSLGDQTAAVFSARALAGAALPLGTGSGWAVGDGGPAGKRMWGCGPAFPSADVARGLEGPSECHGGAGGAGQTAHPPAPPPDLSPGRPQVALVRLAVPAACRG